MALIRMMTVKRGGDDYDTEEIRRIKMNDYTIKIKTISEMIIEDLTHTLFDAQEYFDVDLMPEIMAIANKISKRKDK